MGLRASVCQCAFAFVATCVLPFSASGQSLKPIPPQRSASRIVGSQSLPTKLTDSSSVPFSQSDKPYQLTSRIHLQRGANTGYLVFRVDLKKGSHIYALTQTGKISPSKIKVAPSRQFQLTGKFSPDRPPTITEFDPDYGQRVEKHTGVVQFFAPIKIAPGIKPSELTAELTFNGQVCTNIMCLPIMDVKVPGKFAAYFDRKAEKRTSSQTNGTPRKPATVSESVHR